MYDTPWLVNGAYSYSPAFAQLIWPFTLLPWPVFAAAWTLGSIACLFWMRVPWMLAFPGVIDDILRGNIHVFLAAAIVLAIRGFPAAWTFGIVTKIWVRITRNPEAYRTLLGVFETVDDATNTISDIIGAGIVPAALEMLDQLILQAVEAAFHFGFPLDAGAVLIMEVDGLEAGLDADAERIVGIALKNHAREVRRANSEAERLLLWKSRKQAFGAVGRLVVRVGAHAQVRLVLEHTGSARYSAITSVLVGDGAHVNVLTLQDWDDDAVHLGRDAIRVGRDAFVRHTAISFGGDVVRMHANVEYAGPGGEAELLGLYFADEGQHIEHRGSLTAAGKAPAGAGQRGVSRGARQDPVEAREILLARIVGQ